MALLRLPGLPGQTRTAASAGPLRPTRSARLRTLLFRALFPLAFLTMAGETRAAPATTDNPEGMRDWTMGDTTLSGRYKMLDGEIVHVALENGETVQIDFAEIPARERQFVIERENVARPSRSPDWLENYAIRYRVRLMDDPLAHEERRTVSVSIPTGGWLKPDASDLRVVTASGKVLPAAVLSHNPEGDTLVQFTRHGMDRWYWVYAVNPDASPQVGPAQLRKIEQTRENARAASRKVMELRREAAEVSGELRDIKRRIAAEEKTLENVTGELAQLEELLPKRRAAARQAREALPALERKLAAAEETLRKAEAEAEAMLEKVRRAEERAKKAEAEAKAAETAYQATLRRARAEFDEMTRQRMINEAQAVMNATRQMAEMRKNQVAEAEEAAVPARMAAAGARTDLEAARKELTNAQRNAERLDAAVEKLVEQQTAARELKTAAEARLADLRPRIQPLTNTAAEAAAEAEKTAARAKELEAEFHALSLATDPRTHREGLSMEVRDWGGEQLDELSEWAVVVQGLMKSDNVLGNSFVTDILQKMNPFRLGDTLNFAASYRGFLNITKSGLYRFFLNSDDASFLFLNDYLVFSRVGSNRPIQRRVNVFEVGEDIELDTGVYRMEIHQVTGNTPDAVGRCAFYWIPPGEDAWSRVPPSAFVPSLKAVVTGVEAADGAPVAIPSLGVANLLSSGGFTLYLVRFNAAGAGPQSRLEWDFGDGTKTDTLRGNHLFFREGDYRVSLRSHPALPPFRKRFHVWPAPTPPSPLAIDEAIAVLETRDLDDLDADRLNAAFAFLSICGRESRWPVLERISRKRMETAGIDLPYKVRLYTTLMEALSRRGRTADALELADEALELAGSIRPLTLEIQLQIAEIHRRHLSDFEEAERYYSRIVEENERFALDSVRRAAIRWGDMYVAMGDPARAAEIYRMAARLGRPAGAPAGGVTEAATRGALLRVAEQQLREGNIRHARQLLERIEQEYPEQKVEGLYRFLRAETDRHAGRYLDAIRNYEIVLQLPQWAGYRADAMRGIAECHYRRHDFEAALRQIDAIRKSFPDVFQRRNLDSFRAVVAAAREKASADEAPAAAEAATLTFDENTPLPPGISSPPLPGLGMSGNEMFVVTEPTGHNGPVLEIELPRVVSEGAYWVEFWYRNEFMHSHAVLHPKMRVAFLGPDNTRGAEAEIPVIRTFGLWFHGAALLRAPVADRGKIRMTFDGFQGLHQLDGFRVRPVEAAEEEALKNLLEGVNRPFPE